MPCRSPICVRPSGGRPSGANRCRPARPPGDRVRGRRCFQLRNAGAGRPRSSPDRGWPIRFSRQGCDEQVPTRFLMLTECSYCSSLAVRQGISAVVTALFGRGDGGPSSTMHRRGVTNGRRRIASGRAPSCCRAPRISPRWMPHTMSGWSRASSWKGQWCTGCWPCCCSRCDCSPASCTCSAHRSATCGGPTSSTAAATPRLGARANRRGWEPVGARSNGSGR